MPFPPTLPIAYFNLTMTRSLTLYVKSRSAKTVLCSKVRFTRSEDPTARIHIPRVNVVGTDVSFMHSAGYDSIIHSVFDNLIITTLTLSNWIGLEWINEDTLADLWTGVRHLVLELQPRPHSQSSASGRTFWTPGAISSIFDKTHTAWTLTVSVTDSRERAVRTLAAIVQDCSRTAVLRLPQLVHPDGGIVLRVADGRSKLSLESKLGWLSDEERAVVTVQVETPRA